VSAHKSIPIDEALARLDAGIQPLPVERVPLERALSRVTAMPVAAQCDLPPFDQSAMDGYALRAADAAAAPLSLPLAATVAAGPHTDLPRLPSGHACRIYTGGLMPLGADTVIRQEWTEAQDGAVLIKRAIPVGHDMRSQGEELRLGTPMCPAGRRLDPGLIGALAMAGVAEVEVRRAPRIRVLVSGDEVIPAGQSPRPGEVFNANGPLLAAWLGSEGYDTVQVTQVADTPEAVRAALLDAFESCDLVISTGGVSVGDRDLIAPEAERLGAQRLFWKVAQKPGKPLFVARRGTSLLMGLPGNPASVLVNLAVFVRRALDRLEGLTRPGPQMHAGILAADVRADAERETWLRMRLEFSSGGQILLHPQPHQASHMLSNLAQANVLARLPMASVPIAAGSAVPWLWLGHAPG
jgi:molybdopterin molybdotransferase